MPLLPNRVPSTRLFRAAFNYEEQCRALMFPRYLSSCTLRIANCNPFQVRRIDAVMKLPWLGARRSFRENVTLVEDPDRRVGTVVELKQRYGDWIVGRVAGVGGGGPFEVVGTMPGLKKGGTYEFRGSFRESVYGKQLSVETIIPVIPCKQESRKESLKVFLMECVANVGAGLAGRIVDCFGDKTLEVLLGCNEEANGKLQDIKGISSSRAESIIRYCQANRELLEVHVRLRPFGIAIPQCRVIVEAHYGSAMHIIDSDPFELCKLRGLSFNHVDVIALSIPGFDPRCTKRIDSGAAHILKEEAGKKGHTAQDLGSFQDEMMRLLDLDRSVVEQKIEQGDLSQVVTFTCTSSGTTSVQLKTLADEERVISNFLRRPRQKGPGLTKEKLKSVAKRCGFEEFEDAQEDAINSAIQYGSVVITGGPGCGKSAIIAALVMTMPTLNIQIVTPTGRAAKVLNMFMQDRFDNVHNKETLFPEAKTIHRLLKEWDWKNCDCDLVIVDEASMVDTELAARLIKTLPEKCELVLVGDSDQLPSIGPGRVLADIIESKVLPVTTLTKIYRQESESAIVALARHVNEGKFDKDFVNALQDSQVQFVEEYQDITYVLEGIVSRLTKDSAPAEFQILGPMKKGDHGIKKINAFFQEENGGEPVKGIRLKDGKNVKVGDKVIQTKNNYDLGLVNGSVGIVVRQATDREIFVDFEGVKYRAEEINWDELDLAYAITIHKSQGSAYPVVIVVLTENHGIMLHKKLLYTAFTRPKEKLIIVGQLSACRDGAKNDGNNNRRTLLKEKLLEIRPDDVAADEMLNADK